METPITTSQPTLATPRTVAGVEWIIDAYECDSSLLTDLVELGNFFALVVEELNLKVIGKPQWHQFPSPGGVTGMYLLSESHLTCHTFPEYRLLTINLYCCNPRPAWSWKDQLQRYFSASETVLRSVTRGEQLPGRDSEEAFGQETCE